MTTKLELAEILRISEETGRGIQEMYILSQDSAWNKATDDQYDLKRYAYRLAPKIVKHDGFSPINAAIFETRKEAENAYPGCVIGRITWETEE